MLSKHRRGSRYLYRDQERQSIARSLFDDRRDARWLFPRLGRFHTRFPHRHVSLTTMVPVDSDAAGTTAEAVIRLGTNEWPKNIAAVLFRSELVIICKSRSLEARTAAGTRQNLKKHTLLTSAASTRAGIAGPQAIILAAGIDNAVEFESSALTYTAALSGHGIALGERAFIDDDIKEGRLVVPFPIVEKTRNASISSINGKWKACPG